MIWIILYVVSVFLFCAISCGRAEKEAKKANQLSVFIHYKPKYLAIFLRSFIWPLYLVFQLIKNLFN